MEHTGINPKCRRTPLSQMVRYARQSDHRYILVLRGVEQETLNSSEWRTKMEVLASRVAVVVEIEGTLRDAHGWKVVALEG